MAKSKKPSNKLDNPVADPKAPPTAKQMEISSLIDPVKGTVTLKNNETGKLESFWPVDAAQLLNDASEKKCPYSIPE